MKAKDLKSAILFGNIKSNAILSLVDRKYRKKCYSFHNPTRDNASWVFSLRKQHPLFLQAPRRWGRRRLMSFK